MVKTVGSRARQTGLDSHLSLINCGTFSKLLNLSVPLCPQLCNADDEDANFIG